MKNYLKRKNNMKKIKKKKNLIQEKLINFNFKNKGYDFFKASKLQKLSILFI